jgi:hypothetical protein
VLVFTAVFYAGLVATIYGDIYHHFWRINIKGLFFGRFFLSSLQILAKCENIRQKTTLPHCNSVILSTVKKLYCIEPKVPMKNRIYL